MGWARVRVTQTAGKGEEVTHNPVYEGERGARQGGATQVEEVGGVCAPHTVKHRQKKCSVKYNLILLKTKP
jgi:hypothetical protein